jgi:TrmH family RNA methyltransferase
MGSKEHKTTKLIDMLLFYHWSETMPEYWVILAEPKFQGNIGAVARTMMNFGQKNLILVNPCEIGDECYKRAKHAKDVLENAVIYSTFHEAIEDLDYIAGTSGYSTKTDKRHLRKNLNPKDFAAKMLDVSGKVGIVFGRENYGLYNEELQKCDTAVTIPSSKEYQVLNLSHSASIILYELFLNRNKEEPKREISGFERDKMMGHFTSLLDVIDYPVHKKKKTAIMFQRILGRAVVSKWEFHELMGVFSRSLNTINKQNEK